MIYDYSKIPESSGYEFKPENWGDSPYQYIPSELDAISNPNNLYHAFLLCKKSVSWKPSIQRFGLNILSNISKIYTEIESKTYRPGAVFEFKLSERGHDRDIKALTVLDRVIQRSLNDNVLIPAVTPYLIYDNGASQKNKGISFSRERFAERLYKAYMEFGKDAYVLQIDFSKYFDNILHQELLNMIQPLISPEEFEFLVMIFDSFRIDVSYMDDNMFDNYRNTLFNSLEYSNIDKSLLTGEKMMEKSVGIGNQTSQVSGIFYPHEIDNYCTIVRGYKYYSRYMDDTDIIAKSKEELYQLLEEIETIATKLGIFINKKKTKVVPIMSQISYLKINYQLTPSGRIIKTVPSETFIRENRRLKKFYNLYIEGKMPLVDILQCYLSWYGTYSIYDSERKINNTDELFRNLFDIRYDVDLNYMLKTLQKQNKEKDFNNMMNI